MLAKLLKYEFKTTGKVILPSYLVLAAVAAVTTLIGTFMPQNNFENNNLPQFLFALLLMVTMLGIFACIFGTIIYGITRFNSLMGPQGYLMFTLPVTSVQHIVAKLIPAVVWAVCSLFVSFAIVPIMVLSIAKMPVGQIVTEFIRAMQNAPQGLGMFLFTLVILMVLGITTTYLMCYAAISMGPSVHKNRLVGTLIAFAAIEFSTQIINFLVMMVTGWAIFEKIRIPVEIINTWFINQGFWAASVPVLITMVPLIIWGTIYFFAARYFISKKLNLSA